MQDSAPIFVSGALQLGPSFVMKSGCKQVSCSLLLQEHERVVESIPVLARPLLQRHLLDMEEKLRPGTHYLTWASMNIDGYLHYAQKVILHFHTQYTPLLMPCCWETALEPWRDEPKELLA